MTQSFKEIVAWQKAHAFVIHILLSYDLSYIDSDRYNNMNQSIEEVSRLLNAYYRGIKERNYL